ncbi:putative ABC transport system permease protein [Kribbella aluminosa]|uniref:ABC transport system permease protein n=1 Tax=Kribbella aluminosa TaxID=416017 RepID=A0ABS4UM14_9ACTN|nr:FtsX-like permease family protein [Kribbella aluminosa]MBP2352677.1 putative ABC transport system permease protein [Kribbella aluminosa]
MFKLGLRSVLAHRLRFVLCTIAVTLGVAFAAGAMVFTDTLSTALKKNFEVSTADITVTPSSPIATGTDRPPTFESSVADQIRTVPGVADAVPQLLVSDVQILGPDGKLIENYGLTSFGASWPRDARTAPFRQISGTPPAGAGQLALDESTASRVGYHVGDQVRIVTPARSLTATLTALTTPAAAGVAAGAPLVSFDGASAQLLLLGQPGWTSIAVSLKPGADQNAVQQAISKTVGSSVDVRTAQQVTAEGQHDLDNTFGGFSTILALFAGLALFVGTFLIVNTFAMVVAQRSRELAMLRAIGASRGQVTWSILTESAVIGFLGSTIGLLIGIGVAVAIRYAYQLLELPIPSASLQVSATTIITCYVLGIGVTVAAAAPAARRAGNLPPVAAMRDDVGVPERSLLTRISIGAFMLLMAALLYGIAMNLGGLPGTVLVVLAGGIAVLAVVMLSPLISRYIVRALMYPFGRAAAVTLGRRNAERNPRRTSATASALMISVSLIAGLLVIAASAKASIDQSITDALGTSGIVVTSDGTPAFSTQVGDRAAKVPGVVAVHRVRQQSAQVGISNVEVSGVSDGTLGGPISTTFDSGSAAVLGAGQVIVPRNLAKTLQLTVGKSFDLKTSTGTHRLTVGGILAPNRLLNAVLLSLPAYQKIGGAGTDNLLYVDVAQGNEVAQVRAGILGELSKDYPTLQVRDQQAYAAAARQPVNGVLAGVGFLLAMAILISLLGIVNTLALGVVERTREIGLLRAIGTDRRQLGRMLRVESIAITLLGSLLGVVIGVGVAASIQSTLVDNGLAVRDIPVLQLVIAVLVAVGFGVLAAVWPARRAARLDVLRAIASE